MDDFLNEIIAENSNVDPNLISEANPFMPDEIDIDALIRDIGVEPIKPKTILVYEPSPHVSYEVILEELFLIMDRISLEKSSLAFQCVLDSVEKHLLRNRIRTSKAKLSVLVRLLLARHRSLNPVTETGFSVHHFETLSATQFVRDNLTQSPNVLNCDRQCFDFSTPSPDTQEGRILEKGP